MKDYLTSFTILFPSQGNLGENFYIFCFKKISNTLTNKSKRRGLCDFPSPNPKVTLSVNKVLCKD